MHGTPAMHEDRLADRSWAVSVTSGPPQIADLLRHRARRWRHHSAYSIALSGSQAIDGSYRPNVLAVSFRRFSLSKVSAVGLHRTTVHLQRAEELMMKTILVPTINSPAMKSTFETALLLAKRTSAYIEGVPLWFGGPEFVVAEQASSFSMEIYRARRQEGTIGARKLFESFMQVHGVAPRSTTDRPAFGWFAEVPPGEGLVGSRGRAFDDRHGPA